jgi:protein-L-isoaspartate(D-aspartate) O-methyltransferase
MFDGLGENGGLLVAIFVLSVIALLGLSFMTPTTGISMEFEPLAHPYPRQRERDHMVKAQLLTRGISDRAVIRAMREVPRHEFVPAEDAAEAYDDHPVPIGFGQTISQPYIVAYMTEALSLNGAERVLEIGTGSGYQAAVLAKLGVKVFTIEIVEELAQRARHTFDGLGIHHITGKAGDGYRGWPEAAPFDAIILTAAPEHIPRPLLDQLAPGGRMILPLGKTLQKLIILTNTSAGIQRKELLPVAFVPMTGEAQTRPSDH